MERLSKTCNTINVRRVELGHAGLTSDTARRPLAWLRGLILAWFVMFLGHL